MAGPSCVVAAKYSTAGTGVGGTWVTQKHLKHTSRIVPMMHAPATTTTIMTISVAGSGTFEGMLKTLFFPGVGAAVALAHDVCPDFCCVGHQLQTPNVSRQQNRISKQPLRFSPPYSATELLEPSVDISRPKKPERK